MGSSRRFRPHRNRTRTEIAVATIGVGFDIDHTLLIDNKLERIAFLRLLEFVVSDGGRYLGTLADEERNVDQLLAIQRGGAFSIEEAVHRFVAERGVTPNDAYAERYKTMALAMVDDIAVPLPGARATIAGLRERGIAVAILTNGWNPLQIRKAARAGFDGAVVASADIGAQKPDARAFGALVEALGVPAAQTWYIGDDARMDVGGALAAGLNAVWIDAEGKSYPADAAAPTRTIHGLCELLEVLPGS
jgi:HAD superfamily hydrolase (TIGR01509 family)